jgi:IS5 family transposase
MVGVRSFTGNTCDSHTVAAQLGQTSTLLQDICAAPKTNVVDLGYRSVDAQIAPVQLFRCGRQKSLTALQRTWLKRHRAVEPAAPANEVATADRRMDRR